MIKCKNCAGNVIYDIESGKMICKFCNSYFDPYEFDYDDANAEEQITKEYSEEVNELHSTDDSVTESSLVDDTRHEDFLVDDTRHEDFLVDDTRYDDFLIDDTKPKTYQVNVFTCPECAGEIISEENEAAVFCPFCGGSTVLGSRISNNKRPTSIIPFKITKEQCKELYRKRMKKAIYAPSGYRDESYIDSFRGIYMPYWVFNVTQNNCIRLKGEKNYRQGNYRIEEEYQIDFNLHGYFDGISHDASVSFADNISGAIAPYDHSEAVKFTPAFMSGFYADTTDVDSDVYTEDIEQIANKAATDEINNHPALDGITVKFPSRPRSELYDTRVACKEEAMYPVWFVSHRQGDRITYATVNGVTGKIAADIPIDINKYLLGSLAIAVPVYIMLMILPTLVPKVTLGISTVLLIIGFISVLIQSNKVRKKEKNTDDKGMLKMVENDAQKPRSNFFQNSVAIGLSVISFALAVFVFVLNPIFDIYYYGTACLGLMTCIISYIAVIENYNILSTRKLPQFNRKGGDDRA